MENIIKCSHPKITGQDDRQDESLTGQVHDQAGLCPLTGCNLKPCHSQSQVWHFKRYGTSQENCSVNTRVGAICGFSTCKLLATNMLVKFYMNGHRQHTIQLKNKQPTRVNHTGVFAFTQICQCNQKLVFSFCDSLSDTSLFLLCFPKQKMTNAPKLLICMSVNH